MTERSNEELALAYQQSSDRDVLHALWKQVQRFVKKFVRRYTGLAAQNRAVDMDDLLQCGFLAVEAAAQAFDGTQGRFLRVLDYFLKRECRAALGLRGRVRTEHYEAVPGSTPLGEDGDGTLLDVLADDALPDADDGLLQDDVQREVYTAIDRLPDKVAGVIRSHCLEGIPQGELAAQMGVSSERVRQIKCKGFAKLRKDPQLRRLVDEACCWRYKGVRSFYRDRTSVTEMAALRRIGGG